MLPRMARPCALLVGGELLSRITDMDDRSTCILFGDGAGAAVVKSTEGAPCTPCWAPGATGRPCGRRARATTRPTST